MIVVSRETTAQTGRDQYENGAGKNRPQTFHRKNNKRFAGKGQSFVAADSTDKKPLNAKSPSRQAAKKERTLCAFAPLRLCVKNVRVPELNPDRAFCAFWRLKFLAI
jgi:hypothetical protein